MHLLRLGLGACTLLLIVARFAYAAISVSGIVRDPSGAPIEGADVSIASAERTRIGQTTTDAAGAFHLDVPAPGVYLLIVSAPKFGESRLSVTVGTGGAKPIDVTLRIREFEDEVTVTAAAGLVQDIRSAGQPVNVIGDSTIGERVDTVVAEAVKEEAGVQLQRTSPTMAGVFVRGLTGNKVNVFVDGVRYSNGAQRGGVNTFLDLIEPGMLESVEVLRGPSSAQYGSDALGGSIQFLTRLPAVSPDSGRHWGGSLALAAGAAQRYGGGDGLLSYSAPAVAVTVSGAARAAGRFRPGGGIDSHAAVTRFFGLRSDALMPHRLPDTGFHQAGGSFRLLWTASPRTRVVGTYARSQQDGGRRYDQLLGGDGNLIADLNDLSLDFGTLRVERLGGTFADYASVSYSLNSQREERVNQGGSGNPAATIAHEPERTTVHGVQAKLAKQVTPRLALTAGGDSYFERLTSVAFNVNPATGAESTRRPRVPDGATFRQGGAYAQTSFDAVPERVRLHGAFRFGGAAYRARAEDAPVAGGQPLWPDDSLTVWSPTFRAGAVATPDPAWTFAATLSRGFRAPHMTDLGTLGLTGSGFEVAAPDVAGLGGTIGTTADAAAVSTGRAVSQVTSESSLQYEGSVAYRAPRWRADLTAFVNTIHGNIQKQTLILPQGAVGTTLGGQPIVAQNANGAVFVSLTTTPVLVRANFDRARVWGLEHTGQFALAEPLSLHTVFTMLRARDLDTGLPPNIEGGTPPPEAYVLARWQKRDRRWWVEPYVHGVWRQSRLSTLDLGDRRTGASRSRGNIQAFFRNGARVRGWIGAGPDGVFGNADDVLLATGETLAQVQDRVLGAGVNAAPLFTAVPGYATLGVRFGVKRGRHELVVHGENLSDENYRGISWGVDGPGRGVSARYVVTF